MNNNTNNLNNPMMGMYGSTSPASACAAMSQQNIPPMFMQWMYQIIQEQLPLIIQQVMQQVMQQMTFAINGQFQSPFATSPSSPQTGVTDEKQYKTNNLDNEYMTVKQTAKLLHVNEVTLWRWHKEGKLIRHKIGNSRILYKREDVYNIINSHNNI